MRRKNDLQLYKTYSKKPRILKVAELIKRTLAEILISQNFTLENGKNFIVFIKNVELSKDAKIATVFLKSFSNNHIDEESIIDAIEKSVLKIKKDFSRKIQLRYTPKLRFRIDFKKEEKLTDELND